MQIRARDGGAGARRRRFASARRGSLIWRPLTFRNCDLNSHPFELKSTLCPAPPQRGRRASSAQECHARYLLKQAHRSLGVDFRLTDVFAILERFRFVCSPSNRIFENYSIKGQPQIYVLFLA